MRSRVNRLKAGPIRQADIGDEEIEALGLGGRDGGGHGAGGEA